MENIETNIKERVLQIAKAKGIKYEVFFEELGVTYGNFKGKAKGTPLNSDTVANILDKHYDINPEWLLTGHGEMWRSNRRGVVFGDNNHRINIGNNINSESPVSKKNKVIDDGDLRLEIVALQIENKFLKERVALLEKTNAEISSLISRFTK